MFWAKNALEIFQSSCVPKTCIHNEWAFLELYIVKVRSLSISKKCLYYTTEWFTPSHRASRRVGSGLVGSDGHICANETPYSRNLGVNVCGINTSNLHIVRSEFPDTL